MGTNFVAIIVAVLASMVVGYLWFSPFLFANKWMKLVGKTKSDLKPDPMMYVYTAILGLVAAYTLEYFIKAMGATSLAAGAMVGLWAGVGFVATSFGVMSLFESRPRDLFLINAGHQLVNLVVMGAVLGMMG